MGLGLSKKGDGWHTAVFQTKFGRYATRLRRDDEATRRRDDEPPRNDSNARVLERVIGTTRMVHWLRIALSVGIYVVENAWVEMCWIAIAMWCTSRQHVW